MVKFIFIFVLGFVMCGCASIKEKAKGLLGVSTKVLEAKRDNAIKNTFNLDYNTCYERVKKSLTSNGSYTYAEDKHKQLIAVYVSESDTTPVGVFFKAIDSASTQVEVSSPSIFAKELIAGRILNDLIKQSNEGKVK